MPKFKVGDRARVKSGLIPGYDAKQRHINSSMVMLAGEVITLEANKSVSSNKKYDFTCKENEWHWAEDWLEGHYPDTPAGRKQEQLDLIAEKEAVLAETLLLGSPGSVLGLAERTPVWFDNEFPPRTRRFIRMHRRRKDPNRAFKALLVLGLALLFIPIVGTVASIIAVLAVLRLLWVLGRMAKYDAGY